MRYSLVGTTGNKTISESFYFYKWKMVRALMTNRVSKWTEFDFPTSSATTRSTYSTPNTVMAAVEGAISMSLIPERRDRMEVIDVDSLDDDLLSHQRPFQRRRLSERESGGSRSTLPETITIEDSDEEQGSSNFGSNPLRRGPHTSHRHASRQSLIHRFIAGFGHRIFSPPPPPQDNTVPPVPLIPPRFAGQQSLPMRRLPPPFPSAQPVPDVVRAIERPFEFEANIQSVPQAENTPPFPQAAAPSHHVPSMGLGGALISQHRRHGMDNSAIRRRAAREHVQDRVGENIGQIYGFYRTNTRRISGGYRNIARTFSWTQNDHDAIVAQILAAQDLPDLHFFPASNDDTRRAKRSEPDYLPSYTHPANPASGFTFDFAPPSPSPPATASSSMSVIVIDDSPVASTSAFRCEDAATLLVCAFCLDPLILGGGKDDNGQRLWGMRCGHMIDGKCMDQIMKPASAVDLKGKGKATDGEPPDRSDGKASSMRLRTSHLLSGRPTSQEPQLGPAYFTRRRLTPQNPFNNDPPTPPRHRGRPQAKSNKGKGKAIEPRVEATHEWTCPVPGCGRSHTSLLIEGKWIMDKEKGAIAIYA